MGIIAYLEKVMFGNGKSQQSPEKEEGKAGAAGSGKDCETPNVNDVWKPRISMVSHNSQQSLSNVHSPSKSSESSLLSINQSTLCL